MGIDTGGLALGLLPYGGGDLLPFEKDFSALPDGALPAPFTGSAWAISGAKALNTLSLGTELLTDPGLEAAPYVDGLCPTLTAHNSPTCEESAVVRPGSAGVRAQKVTGTAFNSRLNFYPFLGTAYAHYLVSLWVKRLLGSAGNTQLDVQDIGGADSKLFLTSAAYQQYTILFRAKGGNIFVFAMQEYGLGPFDTMLLDDASAKQLADENELLATLPPTQANVVIKVRPAAAITDRVEVGAIARSDHAAGDNPQNYLQAYLYRNGNYVYAALDKIIGGVPASLIDEYVTEAVGSDLEVRTLAGGKVQLWYNGAQVGAEQTEAVTAENTRHGLYGYGVGISRFFVSAS